MKTNLLNFLILEFLFASLTFLLAQSNLSIYQNYNISSGLSQSQVNCILQDSTGYLWTGTQIGLNGFDGYQFTSFFNDPNDSTSLSNNNIRDLMLDDNDDIWIATHGGCLNKFIKKEQLFKRYMFAIDSAGHNQHAVLTKLHKINQNSFLVGTEKNGLLKFDKDKDQFTQLVYFEDNKLQNHITAICNVDNKLTAIGTESGLFIINLKDVKIVNSLLDNKHITTIINSKPGIIITDYKGKLYKIEKENIIKHKPVISTVHDFKVPVNSIYDDGENIFIGVDTCLIISPNDELKINSKEIESDELQILSGLRIKSFFKDRSNVLWIGTIDKGLFRFPPNQHNFHTLHLNNVLKNSSSVWSVIKDSQDKIWIGSDGDGLICYNRKNNSYKQWINNADDGNSLSNNYVSSILESSDGKIWVSTYGGGVNVFDGNVFKHLDVNTSPYSISHSRVWQVIEDSDNNFWLATKNGLDFYNPKQQTVKHYQKDDNPDSLNNDVILTVFEDSENLIWIGTYGGGLNLFTKETNTFKAYTHLPNDSSTISDNSVMCICEDSKGYLWIGTDIGLNKFDKKTEKFKRYFEKDGLSNNVVYSVIADTADVIWMSTNKGISRFDLVKNEFKNYDYRDGIQSDEFNEGAYFKAKDGEIFLGGLEGITFFYPDEINENLHLTNIVLTALKVFNEDLLPRNYKRDIQNLEVEYNQNYIQIEFAGLEFTDPQKIKYKYKLEGFDNQWNYSGDRHLAIYTNLDPGKYVFKAIATNNDGIWGKEASLINLSVLPPYWMTWWFRISLAVLILFILWSLHKIRLKRLIELEKLRIKIASDLHDEVGASLTSLSIQSQMLSYEKDASKLDKRIEIINNISKNAINTMRDVVWSIDSRNDSLQELIEKMKETSFQILNDRDIDIKYNLNIESPGNKLNIAARQNIYLIFKEAINNTVNHSNATDIEVNIIAQNNSFDMSIKDNGSGINNPEDVHHNGGLANMKLRAERINGKLEIISNNGVGIELEVSKI